MLVRAILLNPAITELNIDGNPIGDQAALYMLEALRDCKTLKKLVVSPYLSRAVFTLLMTAFGGKKASAAGGKKKGGKSVVKKKKK
jgi:hypothetical protein